MHTSESCTSLTVAFFIKFKLSTLSSAHSLPSSLRIRLTVEDVLDNGERLRSLFFFFFFPPPSPSRWSKRHTVDDARELALDEEVVGEDGGIFGGANTWSKRSLRALHVSRAPLPIQFKASSLDQCRLAASRYTRGHSTRSNTGFTSGLHSAYCTGNTRGSFGSALEAESANKASLSHMSPRSALRPLCPVLAGWRWLLFATRRQSAPSARRWLRSARLRRRLPRRGGRDPVALVLVPRSPPLHLREPLTKGPLAGHKDQKLLVVPSFFSPSEPSPGSQQRGQVPKGARARRPPPARATTTPACACLQRWRGDGGEHGRDDERLLARGGVLLLLALFEATAPRKRIGGRDESSK